MHFPLDILIVMYIILKFLIGEIWNFVPFIRAWSIR